VRSEVLTAVSIKITVFLEVTAHRLIEILSFLRNIPLPSSGLKGGLKLEMWGSSIMWVPIYQHTPHHTSEDRNLETVACGFAVSHIPVEGIIVARQRTLDELHYI
jgi:hypothetical protein